MRITLATMIIVAAQHTARAQQEMLASTLDAFMFTSESRDSGQQSKDEATGRTTATISCDELAVRVFGACPGAGPWTSGASPF